MSEPKPITGQVVATVQPGAAGLPPGVPAGTAAIEIKYCALPASNRIHEISAVPAASRSAIRAGFARRATRDPDRDSFVVSFAIAEDR